MKVLSFTQQKTQILVTYVPTLWARATSSKCRYIICIYVLCVYIRYIRYMCTGHCEGSHATRATRHACRSVHAWCVTLNDTREAVAPPRQQLLVASPHACTSQRLLSSCVISIRFCVIHSEAPRSCEYAERGGGGGKKEREKEREREREEEEEEVLLTACNKWHKVGKHIAPSGNTTLGARGPGRERERERERERNFIRKHCR